MANTLEYILKLSSGAFDGPLNKARSGMRGAKGDAESLNQSLGKAGSLGNSSAGLGGLMAGMVAVQMATQRTEPLFKRLFHSMEVGVGRTARVFRVGGGITQIGAMLSAQLPGMTRYRAGLQAVEDRAHKLNTKLETLASMGGRSSGGMGMSLIGGGAAGAAVSRGGAASAPEAGGGLGMMGVVKGGALAGMVASVMTGLKSSVAAADRESAEIAFKNLLGSGEAAKSMLRDLTSFAAKTPFEMPEVQAAAGKLLSAGVAADKLTGSMSVLGNITAAYQADLGSVATIYAQVVNKGQLYAEEIQQFGENGVPALRLLAEASGKTTAQIMEMAQAGELSAADLARAFDKAGGSGGKFANAMKDQGASTKGLFSTLKDTINQIWVRIGTPLNNWLKPWLQEGINIADRLGVAVEAGVNIGRKAIAGGQLGELLGLSLRVGMAQFTVFAASGMAQLAAAFKTIFTGTITGDQVGGFMGDIIQALSGMGDIIRSEMGAAFNGVVARFQAGLTMAASGVMKMLGSIPMLGDAMGLSNFQMPKYDDLARGFYDQGGGDMAGLKNQGKEKIRAAFDVQDLQGQLQSMFKGLDVGADFRKLQDAISGSTSKGVEDGADKASASLAAAIGEGTSTGASKKGSSRKGKADKLDPNSRYDEEGRRRSDGRKKIVSKRDGSTTATRSDNAMTDQAGISDQLFSMRQGSKFRREGLKGFDVGGFLGKNIKPGIAKDAVTPEGLRGRLTPPDIKLTPPGAAKRQDSDRREQAAQASRAAGGGGADKPRWDLVANIEKRLSGIAAA